MANSYAASANRLYTRHKALLIALLLIVFLFVLGQVTVSNFLSLPQILLTVKLSAFIALFGLCQLIVIAGGGSGLDLSVGYAATITAVLTASIMDGKNENLWMALLVAVGIGLVVGLLNGMLTAYVKLPPLVVTLAMSNILQGAINVYTAGQEHHGTAIARPADPRGQVHRDLPKHPPDPHHRHADRDGRALQNEVGNDALRCRGK